MSLALLLVVVLFPYTTGSNYVRASRRIVGERWSLYFLVLVFMVFRGELYLVARKGVDE